MKRFEGRVAVVTGAARGIGRATASLFAAQGAKVAVLDLLAEGVAETAELIGRSGGTARAYACDVTQSETVNDVFARIASDLGGVDILVNNAGVMREMPITTMTEEQWDSELDVNLKSAYLCSKAASPHMVSRNAGRIVMIASRAVHGAIRHSAYSAAKAGVSGFTAALAWELGPSNVTVNAVAPGHVRTELAMDVARRQGIPYEELKKSRIAGLAIKYVAEPEDIANVIGFLASDESRYITGQTIFATGRPHI